MSAHEMVCHVSDGFRMAMGQKAVRDATSPLKSTLVKWVALYLPLPWPDGIRTNPEIDQEVGGTRPVDFAADLGQLAALLELFTAPTTRLDRSLHATLGRMSRSAWLRWGYRHVDHHLRQFGA